MYTPKLENGDIVLDQSGVSTNLTGKSAATQIVQNAFLMWKGEWFLEPSHGIDWLSIMKKNKSIDDIIQIISTGLIKNPYIQKVVDITIDFVDDTDRKLRHATLNYIVLIDNANITGSISL